MSFGRYADYYDFLYGDKDYAGECALLDACIQRYSKIPVSTVLDIGCGTGGHLVQMAGHGWEATGVDPSASMLGHAGNKTRDVRPPVTLFQADAKSFNAGRNFDMVVAMFASLCYVTDNASLASTFQNVRRHLRPGGIFVMDFWYGPAVLRLRPERRLLIKRELSREVMRLATPTLDTYSHTVSLQYTLFAIERDQVVDRFEEDHRVRFFFPQEITYFLQTAGLEVRRLAAFPDASREPTDGDWNAFLVAS